MKFRPEWWGGRDRNLRNFRFANSCVVFHIGGIEGKGVELFGKRLAGSSDGGAGEIVR